MDRGYISHPGPKYPCYLLRRDSALYIGQFDYFIQAFNQWRTLPDREQWLIVGTKDALRIVNNSNLRDRKYYLKFDEPRPLKRHYNERGGRPGSARGADGKFVA